DRLAREAGQLCGIRGTADVIDASVVLAARARGHRIVTSDPEDLERLDPRADLIVLCLSGFRCARGRPDQPLKVDGPVSPTGSSRSGTAVRKPASMARRAKP